MERRGGVGDGRGEGKAKGILWLGGFAMQVNFDCGLLSPAVVFGKVIGSQHSWYGLETAALCVIVHLSSLLSGLIASSPSCSPSPPPEHH